MVQVDPAERIAIGEHKSDSSAVKPMKCIPDVPVCAPALRSVARGRLTAPWRNRNLGYAAIHFRLPPQNPLSVLQKLGSNAYHAVASLTGALSVSELSAFGSASYPHSMAICRWQAGQT